MIKRGSLLGLFHVFGIGSLYNASSCSVTSTVPVLSHPPVEEVQANLQREREKRLKIQEEAVDLPQELASFRAQYATEKKQQQNLIDPHRSPHAPEPHP